MKQLEIDSVKCFLVDIPTIRPHKLSMVTMGCQTLTIVEMRCSNNITGWGEATTIGGLSYGPESPESIKSAIDTYLAPMICHKAYSGVEQLAQEMNASVKGNFFAKSALETAFLDALGKSEGMSVSGLLGGALTKRLPVLWTLASGDTERDIAEAKSLIDEGRHKSFKLKVGAKDTKTDLRHVLAIKNALGDDINVQIDVNQAWNMNQALLAIPVLQEAGISMIEQPLPLWDRQNLVELSRRFNTTVLADEALTDHHSAFALANAGFTGAYALKIAKAGGPAQVLKVAHVAESAGIALYGGTMLEGTLGTVASLHSWSTVKMSGGTEMFGPLLLKDDIVVDPLSYSNGEVILPEGTGLGIEIDLDKLKYYARK